MGPPQKGIKEIGQRGKEFMVEHTRIIENLPLFFEVG